MRICDRQAGPKSSEENRTSLWADRHPDARKPPNQSVPFPDHIVRACSAAVASLEYHLEASRISGELNKQLLRISSLFIAEIMVKSIEMP